MNHAFSSALAPVDIWNEPLALDAVQVLGLDPAALACVYCDEPAQTWDHLEPLVAGSKPSGFGHTLGNLVPACRDCNSAKGNKPWKSWLETWPNAPAGALLRVEAYVAKFRPPRRNYDNYRRLDPQGYDELLRKWQQILELMKEADIIAAGLQGAAAGTA